MNTKVIGLALVIGLAATLGGCPGTETTTPSSPDKPATSPEKLKSPDKPAGEKPGASPAEKPGASPAEKPATSPSP